MSALNWCSLLRQVDLQTFKDTEDWNRKVVLWQECPQPHQRVTSSCCQRSSPAFTGHNICRTLFLRKISR